jgi:hypothetical protein
MSHEFLTDTLHILLQPFLLFFYAGFLLALVRVRFEFPNAIYQAFTIYLLFGLGYRGGQQLADLSSTAIVQAIGFVALGLLTNAAIGVLAYEMLRKITRLRQIDAAAIAGHYGSASAVTFIIAAQVLVATKIAFAPYLPVVLIAMESPGCLLMLYLAPNLRAAGYDAAGNGREKFAEGAWADRPPPAFDRETGIADAPSAWRDAKLEGALVGTVAGDHSAAIDRLDAQQMCATLALEPSDIEIEPAAAPLGRGLLSPALFAAVFLNPGILLLCAALAIGLISRLQSDRTSAADNLLYLYPGVLCLFLLAMGMTAASKLSDLRAPGWPLVAFGLLAPNLFAAIGVTMAHLYSLFLGRPFDVGTYVLFAVLCASASHVALPAVQRLAMRAASPTLPLAAALGLTFTYNVTIGIPVYLLMANALMTCLPVHSI